MVEISFNPNTYVGSIDLPTLASNTAVSVGFAGGDSLAPFMNEIRKIFGKDLAGIRETTQDLKDNSKDLNKELAKESKKQIEKLKEMQSSLNRTADETNKLSGIVKDSIEKDEKIFNAYGKTFLNLITKGAATYYQNVISQVNMLRELESAGVQLHKGYDSLYEGANQAGMKMSDFAGHLKRMSPIIAQLNSAYKKGSEVFASSVANIDKNLLLTNDEKVAVFESLVNSLGPSQLQKMSADQLKIETNNLAKQMKMLSIATGKSVENLAKENDIKSKQLRIRAYAATHPEFKQMQMALQSIGLSGDDWLDYFASGGANMTPELAVTIAGSDFLQAALPHLNKGFSNKTLNEETIKNIKQRYGNLANSDFERIKNLSSDNAIQMASSKSDNFQSHAFGALDVIQAVQGLNTNTSLEGDTTQAEQTKEILKSSKSIVDSMNQLENRVKDVLSGGIDGMTKSLNVAKTGLDLANETLKTINDKILRNYGLNGTTSALGAAALSMGGDFFGTFLANAAFSSFSKSANLGKAIGYIKNTPKTKIVKDLFTKQGAKAVGKVATPIAGLVTTYNGINEYQKYKNGEKSGAEAINDTIGGWSGGAMTGASIGALFGPIGALVGAGIGATAGYISSKMAEGEIKDSNQSKPNSQIGETKEEINKSIERNDEHNHVVEKNINNVCMSLSNIIDLTKQTNDYLNKICNNGTYYAPYNSGLDYKSN